MPFFIGALFQKPNTQARSSILIDADEAGRLRIAAETAVVRFSIGDAELLVVASCLLLG